MKSTFVNIPGELAKDVAMGYEISQGNNSPTELGVVSYHARLLRSKQHRGRYGTLVNSPFK
jgi:hypothetical protein